MPTQSEVPHPETSSFQAPEARLRSRSPEDPVNKANIWRAAKKYIRFLPVLAILAVSACSSVDGATTPVMMLTGTEGAGATEMVPLPTPSATPEIPSPTVNKPIEASPTPSPTATVKPTETPPPTPTKTEVPPSPTPTEIPKDWAEQYFLKNLPEGAKNVGMTAAKDRKNVVVKKEGEVYASCPLKSDVSNIVKNGNYLVSIEVVLDEPNGDVCLCKWGTKASIANWIASEFPRLSQSERVRLLERDLALSEAMMDAILALPCVNPYLDAVKIFGLNRDGNTVNWLVWNVPHPVPNGYKYPNEVLPIPLPPPTPTP